MEFFVTLASFVTFIAVIGLHYWFVIAGLIGVGVIAAPIAAFISRKLPVKTMMIMVGIMVIAISIRFIFKTFF